MCGITSRVHRKRLGKYGDLERLLASVVLSPLGDARGVVVRQHFCERRRVSFVGCKDLSPGLVGVDVEKSKRMAPLVSGTGVKSAMGERAQPRRYTSAWAMRSHATMRPLARAQSRQLTSRSTSKAAAAGRGRYPSRCPSRDDVCRNCGLFQTARGPFVLSGGLLVRWPAKPPGFSWGLCTAKCGLSGGEVRDVLEGTFRVVELR